ncbi:porin family protein [Sulfuricaulis sp.]
MLLAMMSAPSVSWALETGYSLGYGLDYTDNAFLTPDNRRDEWVNSARAGFSLIQSSSSLDATILSSVEHRQFKNNTYPDDTLFNLNLLSKWNILPQRLSWTVEDFYTQTPINTFQPNTPNNQQNTNIVSTGPDISLRVNPVNTLEFGARYTRNTYQSTNIDNTGTSGSAKWAYQSSPDTQLSLNLDASSVKYDTQVGGASFDFTRKDGFAELSSKFARNIFVIDAGATRIIRKNGVDVTGGLGRFSWKRQISSTSNFALYASSQLSDASQQALSQGQAASQGGLQPSFSIPVVSGDVFREKSAELVYDYQRAYGDNTFRLFRQKDDFKVSPADEDRRGGSFEIGYDFSGALTTSIFGSFVHVENFATRPSLIYWDTTVGARLVNRLTSRLTLGLDLSENRREGSPGFTGYYTEHRGLLTLTYSDIRRVDTRQ